MIRDFNRINMTLIHILSFVFCLSGLSFPQTFTKVTDPSNPIVTAHFATNYSGAAWIDFNNDGNLDLFTTINFLFKGDGNGNFEEVMTELGSELSGQSNGPSWGDYDNDGNIDCFIAAKPSRLYRNDGNGVFTPILKGDLGTDADTRGWASSWADADNDGYIDLFVTHPAGYVGPGPTPSHLYFNNTDGTFTEDFDYEFSQQLSPYTIATWYDYDLDGDVDLFIGCGPVNTLGVDRLYKNMFVETRTASFERIDSSPIATDLQNGQIWNFIDYDNDGDLDAFVTNYADLEDKFYRNDNSTYVNLDNSLSTNGSHLGNAWGDFDNDGDLDVVVTSDEEAGNLFFRNDNGTFTKDTTAFTVSGNTRASAIGDYNNDGKLDIFFSGTGDAVGLFQNATQNNNKWVEFDLTGTVSNHSALGAKVKLKATINGNPVWQYREVNAQNGFNSQNALRIHFGLGNASAIDSVIVIWSGGVEDILTNLSVNDLYAVTETIPSDYLRADFSVDTQQGYGTPHTAKFTDISVVDPNMSITSWEWDFNNDGIVDATVQNPQWDYDSLGTYSVKLTVHTSSSSDTKTKTGYITIDKLPGYPVITSIEPTFTDTTVELGTNIHFLISAIDTTGNDISYEWIQDGLSKSTGINYNYRATVFEPAPRTDTVMVNVSNGFNTFSKIWYIHVENVTGVDQQNNTYPEQFSLGHNYPNPFNPATKIKYSVAEEAYVVLKIYNIVGQEVEVLVNEKKSPGYYETDFNAKNLPSGIYIYKITAGKYSSSKKMVLIK